MSVCNLPDPLCGLGIGSKEQRRVQVSGNVLTHQACGSCYNASRAGHHLIEPMDSVQMRIDRHDFIESCRQKTTNNTLTDRLARREADILSHVTKVRANERESFGTTLSRRLCSQQQFDQLVVRLIQRAANDYVTGNWNRDFDATLAVWKAVQIDHFEPYARCRRQSPRWAFIVRKGVYHAV
jgi:hypothetical protein